MKVDNPTVLVPYMCMNEHGNWERAWSRFRFAGTVDHRRVRRMIRKRFKEIGIKIRKDHLTLLVSRNSYTEPHNQTQGKDQRTAVGEAGAT